MGQSQSSSTGTSAEPEEPLKRDYYDLLSVERTATDEEIKKAYRRKALELHPDRNYGNEEGATRLFAEVQAAYEVLSDAQERAWYDSHRDVLLRGETVGEDGAAPGSDNFAYGGKMTSTEDVLKLMMKFTSRVQFTDAPSGFYGGLNEFFGMLAKEEDIAAQWEGEESIVYPEFGLQNDDYDDVVRPFYAAWNGFATKKSYAWKDKWRLSDAPDRRIRRLMEKENRKNRDDAIFEFNDAVRSLVAFIRKRDPRVQNNQKSEAERQKALRDLAAAQAARSRAQREAELEKFSLPDWANSREQEKDPNEGGFSSEEEQEQHEYECVVCDKVFKSEKQYQAHERSKKHIKLLKELKRDMKKEGKDLELEQDGSAVEVQPMEDESENDESSVPEKQSKDMNIESARKGTDNEAISIQRSPSSKMTAFTPESESEEETDSDYAPRTKVEQRLTKHASDSESNNLTELTSDLKGSSISASGVDTPLSTNTDFDTDGISKPKVGKAKLKRAKKAAAASSGTSDAKSGSEFKCVVCQGDFISKTKLFKHIEEENHAAPISQIKGGPKSGGGKGKKK